VKLFFSYARPDRQRADSLAQRLRQAGYEVWLDSELTGGQAWWEKILEQVRMCDALVMMVSWTSITSQACMYERSYATQLGKAVLPVAVEEIHAEVLPPDIGRLQVIDYSQPSETAAFQLIGSVMKLLPPPPLPDPLPEPPSIPISYLAAIADRLSRAVLTRDDQFVVVGILEEALGSPDPSDRSSALKLLAQMESRTDLLAVVDKRITILKTTRQATETAQSPETAPGTGSAPSTGTDFRWQDRPKPETRGGVSPSADAQGRGSKSPRSEAAQPKREWQRQPSAQKPQPQPSTQQQWQPSAQKPQPQSPPQQQWQPSAQKPPPQPPPQQQWQPPPPPQPPPSPQPPVVPVPQVIVAISPHWAMAVWTVIFFWPLGIFAVISAARVKPSVASGDVAAAQKASSRVRVLFWISLILVIISIILVIVLAASAAKTNSQYQ
jgi:hypothetical protein